MKAILLVVVSATMSMGQVKDVDGWDKIKWGMTIQQARAAYSSDSQPEVDEYWTHQKLESMKIEDMDVDVYALAKHGSDQVAKVQLTWLFYERSKLPGGAGFETLKTLLTQKYGAPASDEEKKGAASYVLREITWVFLSTSIVLSLSGVAVSVEYRRTDKRALDVL